MTAIEKLLVKAKEYVGHPHEKDCDCLYCGTYDFIDQAFTLLRKECEWYNNGTTCKAEQYALYFQLIEAGFDGKALDRCPFCGKRIKEIK